MTLLLVLTYVHLVTSVLLVGYLLFWFIMTVGMERQESPAEGRRLTEAMLAGARWPPAVVPWGLRLTFPGLGWALLLVLVGTGLWLLALGPRFPLGGLLGLKLALLAALVVGHALLRRRPTRGPATVNLLLALALVLASALLRR